MLEFDIGFTGTQNGMTVAQATTVSVLLHNLRAGVISCAFRHGCCIGADEQAHRIALQVKGMHIYGHPSIKKGKQALLKGLSAYYGPRDYLSRNRDIVDKSNVLIGTPKENTNMLRSGTWYTIRYAVKTGVPVLIVTPDGEIRDWISCNK